MTRFEGDPSGQRGNIPLVGYEIFSNLELGREAAREAINTDRELLINWLDENFPYTYGPDRNEPKYPGFDPQHPSLLGVISADFSPVTGVWHKESVSKAVRLLGGDVDESLFHFGATGGKDWIDDTYGIKYFGVVATLPSALDVDRPDNRTIIAEMSQQITKDSVMQSFGGAIIRLPGVVCQLTELNKTFGFAVSREKSTPDSLIVRAWRTE